MKFGGLLFVLMYFEQLARYVILRINTFLGRNVICDRYPGANVGSCKYKRLYSFFPKADVYILLVVDAQEVILRKDEISLDDVIYFYSYIEEVIPKKKSVKVENTNSDLCLNEIAQLLFGFGV
jgi:thymidylate kinase